MYFTQPILQFDLVLPLCSKIYILARVIPRWSGALSVRKSVMFQILLVLLAACVAMVFSLTAALSIFLGGLACIVPTVLFAFFFFSKQYGRRPGHILMFFYMGELLKMCISTLIMVLAVRYLHLIVTLMVLGFLIGSAISWLAPSEMLKQKMRSA